ncbi:bifunctional diguanylate cyclase/phosphodiesterase [Massilia scottii]|uniref:bifunctional diguanylate cyclase/phosphodiesterase n=1 Tax=Massilia scottii TaxID=3057166 RepID=UPI0027963E01|nr:EAL domain-containing protein [Massilia sp. CCM 9029]MDQ1835093.1 EAL domain-containing protein [Massilia sp. CCM 9029]
MHSQISRRIGEIVVLALLYYIAARLGLRMALAPGYAAPIWPAAGIALAAVLILGNRVAPGVWLGSLLANVAISFDASGTASLVKSLLLPASIAVGATLQAIAGACLIRRFVGFPTPLDRVEDVIKFLGLGGPVSCVISASMGTSAVLLAGMLPANAYAITWSVWWSGDAIGVLVATPLVLTWFGQPQAIWRRRRKTVALPICLAFALIVVVFIGAKEPYFSPSHLLLAWSVLAGGLAFTGVLGAFLLVTSGHAMLFEQLLAQRTHDLERTRKAEQAARQLAAIVTSSDDAIIGKTLDGIVVSWNAGAERMYGYTAGEMLGQPTSRIIPPELADEMAAILERLRRGERIEHLETVHVRKDGRSIDVSLTTSPIRDAEGRVTGASAIARDISERKRAEEALRDREARIRRLVDANIVGIFIGDLSGRISEANDAFLRISGYSREDVLAGSFRWTAITPLQYDAADEHALEELRTTGRCTPYEKEYLRKDGSRIPVLISSALFEGPQQEGVSFVLDLSERKLADERIHHMADHDALTGLPNRTLLQDRMHQAIAFAHRNRRRVAILFIDLDYFKNINDSLGHHIGDHVLKMAAMRLQQCLREGDSVARLGGDEFVLILPLPGDSSDAARVAQKALDSLAQPFSVGLNQLHLGGSIGISLYPDDGLDVDALMRAADTAMYHAKEMGRGNFKFFTAELNRAVQQRLDVGQRLRQALAQDEFILHYQPQVEMESGIIFSAEALLRWQPPGKQPISCGDFIGNAEESGLIVPIGEWVLRQACRQLKTWRDAGHPKLKMAVNLSPRQLEQANFCSLVGQILNEAGIPATALELEITESILMQRSEYNLAMLTRLSDMGIQLSVDDFGTGYSSLAYLQRFPVHSLKIDQSFVRDIGKDQNDTALVTAIIAMAASLRLGVIAEGVENLQQTQFLLAHGCHAAQGYYYSKAVPADTFTELIGDTFKLQTRHLG